MLHWMQWHLDRARPRTRRCALLDHAAYLYRDGLDPVLGLDDGGDDGRRWALGWVIDACPRATAR